MVAAHDYNAKPDPLDRVIAKALDDPSAAREAFDHLERCLRLLFKRPQ